MDNSEKHVKEIYALIGFDLNLMQDGIVALMTPDGVPWPCVTLHKKLGYKLIDMIPPLLSKLLEGNNWSNLRVIKFTNIEILKEFEGSLVS